VYFPKVTDLTCQPYFTVWMGRTGPFSNTLWNFKNYKTCSLKVATQGISISAYVVLSGYPLHDSDRKASGGILVNIKFYYQL